MSAWKFLETHPRKTLKKLSGNFPRNTIPAQGGGGNEDLFKQISEAYTELKTPDKRAQYDASLPEVRNETLAELLKEKERLEEELRALHERRRNRESNAADRREEGSRQNGAVNKEQPRHRPSESSSGSFEQQGKKRLSIVNEYGRAYLSRDGSIVSSGYDSISSLQNGKYFVGQINSLGKYLLDAESGSQVGTCYDDIEFRGPHIIGISKRIGEYLLDSKTGWQLGSSYEHIRLLGKYLIGEHTYLGKRVINPETGSSSISYDTIELRGNDLFGIRYGREEKISHM